MSNPERLDRIRDALRKNKWDLVVCALPMNVLLLSGYWPVVGTGVAVASSEGKIILLVPQDEEDLAKHGWADEVRTFKPGSLNEVITTAEAIRAPLKDIAQAFSAEPIRVGFEAQETPSLLPMQRCTCIAERCATCSRKLLILQRLLLPTALWQICEPARQSLNSARFVPLAGSQRQRFSTGASRSGLAQLRWKRPRYSASL